VNKISAQGRGRVNQITTVVLGTRDWIPIDIITIDDPIVRNGMKLYSSDRNQTTIVDHGSLLAAHASHGMEPSRILKTRDRILITVLGMETKTVAVVGVITTLDKSTFSKFV